MESNQPPSTGTGPIDFRTPAVPPDPQIELPDKSFTSAVFLDKPYAMLSESQKLDIYLPLKGNKPYPVILLIHGGGWLVGDKRWNIAGQAEPVLSRGYAVVSINHRPSNEAVFPAQIYDAKAAVRWIKANAQQYGLDANKIIAWGSSSGGHLAALLGTSGHVQELEDLTLGNPGQSCGVDAVVDISGPIDFLQLDPQIKELGLGSEANMHDVDYGPESRLIGGRISNFPEKCKVANPMTYIGSDSSPFYISGAKNDAAVPYLQGANLANALVAAIGENMVFLDISETGGHGGPSGPGGPPGGVSGPQNAPRGGLPPYSTEKLKKIFDFLSKQLG